MTDDLSRVQALPYPSRVDTVPLPGGAVDLWRPPRAEELLEAMIEGPYDPDEKLPYWADLWPASIGLAEAVADGTVPIQPGEPWLELGAGLGLVAVAAARRGARVIASDWIDDALSYIRASAELMGLELEVRHLDWRAPPPDLSPRRVLASDVLYEARNGPWLAALLDRWREPGFEAWVSDPGRAHAKVFFEQLEGWTVRREPRSVRGPHVPTGSAEITLFHIRPSAG